MKPIDLLVPYLGESIVEAEIVQWFKNVGDPVVLDEILLELETEKITLEIPSPCTGILQWKNENALVQVGECLVRIFEEQESKNQDVLNVIPKNISHEKRIPMTQLRKTIAKRLKDVQNTAVILTTFNEIDMTELNEKRSFDRTNRLESIGLIPFFIQASVKALQKFPIVNNLIEGAEILLRNHYNIGIAIAGPFGLVVPVIFDADQKTLSQISSEIQNLIHKTNHSKLSGEDLQGGTFSISNGGVFGSLMSTPLLNHLQSATLGLHAIQDRPVVINGQILIRSMMYVALSYDHRLIDGKEAIGFLKEIKDCIEHPESLN